MRTAGASAAAAGVAALLVLASVAAALRVPDVQYLRGYPGAAPLEIGRPDDGFVPLAGRFIAEVFGVHPQVEHDTADVEPRHESTDGVVAVAARVAVSHPFVNDSFARAFTVTVPEPGCVPASTTMSPTRYSTPSVEGIV